MVARTNASWEGTEPRSNQGSAEERADSAGLDPSQRRREPRRREEGISSRAIRESCTEPEETTERTGIVNYTKTATILMRSQICLVKALNLIIGIQCG